MEHPRAHLLPAVFSVAAVLMLAGCGFGGDASNGPAASGTSEFEIVESAALRVEVPTAWEDVQSGDWIFVDDRRVGNQISAATNIDAWYEGFQEPGIFFAASSLLADEFDTVTLLDQYDVSDRCTYDGREDVSVGDYSGQQDLYSNCEEQGSEFSILTLAPEGAEFLILLQMQAPANADPEVFRRVAQSIEVHNPDALAIEDAAPVPSVPAEATPTANTRPRAAHQVRQRPEERSMTFPHAVHATVCAVLAALILTACAGQQGQAPTGGRATAAVTAEPTRSPTDEETAEPTPSPTDEDEPGESAEPTDGGDDDDGDYVRIEHATAEMRVDVPTTWTDVDNNDTWALNDEEIGYSLTASTDIESFTSLELEVPGVFFAASESAVDEYTPDELLDEYDLSDICEYDGRDDYSDAVYTGVQDFYDSCGDTNAQFAFLAAAADDGSHIVLVQVSALTDEDLDAYTRILETFLARDLP